MIYTEDYQKGYDAGKYGDIEYSRKTRKSFSLNWNLGYERGRKERNLEIK